MAPKDKVPKEKKVRQVRYPHVLSIVYINTCRWYTLGCLHAVDHARVLRIVHLCSRI